ncbi:MAG: zinc carboxypeptidase [Halobacteriovoraceae bacterium]|nr:zinc carboxypeptidase [Halobacteriovoraceae bacterium]
MIKNLPEIKALRNLSHVADPEIVRFQELTRINIKHRSYPIISFEIGCTELDAPVLGLFGGVHGLERVGTHVITSYLQSLFKQMKWDDDLRTLLKTSRIVSIPLINPGGMAKRWRSNPNGVDLMRNAPVEAEKKNLPFLLSGHQYSNKIPWYRGNPNKMETESQILIDYVKEKVFPAATALTVDFHSGFGLKDRFWYPYAKTTDQFPNIKEVQSLKDLMDETLPHHIYKVEPQSLNYTTHGDIWDYLYDDHRLHKKSDQLFLPWTLEMGSWNWVKKNPKQIFSASGLFNPIIEHRHDRTMRRHKALIDFLFSATRNSHWRN